jgi:hypothetical protein
MPPHTHGEHPVSQIDPIGHGRPPTRHPHILAAQRRERARVRSERRHRRGAAEGGLTRLPMWSTNCRS